MRRLTAALALLTVLVGCSAPFASGPPGADDHPTDTAAEFASPAGYGPDGVTNGSLAAAAHESGLGEYERFRLVIDQRSRIGDRSGRLAFTWTATGETAYANYTSYNGTASETTEVWKTKLSAFPARLRSIRGIRRPATSRSRVTSARSR